MNKLKFKSKPGQIDYTNARWAPVINCVVKYRDKILVVQRSKDLNFYPGYWNGISGFLDDKRSFEQKVKDELREELGIAKNKIKNVWEARNFKWVKLEDVKKLKLLPGFNDVLKRLSKWLP